MKLRTIPEKGNSLISLFKGKGEMTIKEYEDMMLDIELRTEKKIITMLDMIGTLASVKSDRYSLPYTKQIKRSNQITSYVNEALYTQTLLRDIAKVILDENIQKIRFFVFAEIEGGMFGRVNYYFNYYIH
jgi:hypothetical protein